MNLFKMKILYILILAIFSFSSYSFGFSFKITPDLVDGAINVLGAVVNKQKSNKGEGSKDEVSQNEVSQNEVSQNEVSQNEVSQNEVSQNGLTNKKVIVNDEDINNKYFEQFISNILTIKELNDISNHNFITGETVSAKVKENDNIYILKVNEKIASDLGSGGKFKLKILSKISEECFFGEVYNNKEVCFKRKLVDSNGIFLCEEDKRSSGFDYCDDERIANSNLSEYKKYSEMKKINSEKPDVVIFGLKFTEAKRDILHKNIMKTGEVNFKKKEEITNCDIYTAKKTAYREKNNLPLNAREIKACYYNDDYLAFFSYKNGNTIQEYQRQEIEKTLKIKYGPLKQEYNMWRGPLIQLGYFHVGKDKIYLGLGDDISVTFSDYRYYESHIKSGSVKTIFFQRSKNMNYLSPNYEYWIEDSIARLKKEREKSVKIEREKAKKSVL